MTIQVNWQTSATKTGAANLGRMHRVATQEDLGFKIERLISSYNDVRSNLSTALVAISNINSALAYMAACAASFASALSAGGLASTTASMVTVTSLEFTSAMSNFRA